MEIHPDIRHRARVELARRSFEHFILLIDQGYKMGWAQRLIARRLQKFYEDVRDQKSPRLMIFLPPRHSKSLTASQYFPIWAMGQDPTNEIVISSYATSLPERFSRRIRDMVKSEELIHEVFPDMQVHPENQSIEGWQTTLGGWLVPTGRGSALTGFGADIMIIDDIIKDSSEADSVTVREAAMDWYSSVAYTRMYPGGGQIIINTRWSVEDLSGKLLRAAEIAAEEDDTAADIWDVISLPAVAEHDEYLSEDGMYLSTTKKPGYNLIRKAGGALHPARYDENALAKIRATLQPRHWTALYQQNPLPEDGAFFNIEDMRFGAPPMVGDTNVFIAADTAASTAESANDSCIVCGALDNAANLWILDMVVGKLNSYAFCDSLIDMYVKFPSAITVGIEHGPISLAFMPLLEQRMSERRVFLPLKDPKFMRPSQSKEVRARPFQGMMQQKRVWFPKESTWGNKALSQMKKFPQGEADDIVDALAWLGRMALDTGPPNRVQYRDKPLKSWKTRLKNLGGKRRRFLEA